MKGTRGRRDVGTANKLSYSLPFRRPVSNLTCEFQLKLWGRPRKSGLMHPCKRLSSNCIVLRLHDPRFPSSKIRRMQSLMADSLTQPKRNLTFSSMAGRIILYLQHATAHENSSSCRLSCKRGSVHTYTI